MGEISNFYSIVDYAITNHDNATTEDYNRWFTCLHGRYWIVVKNRYWRQQVASILCFWQSLKATSIQHKSTKKAIFAIALIYMALHPNRMHHYYIVSPTKLFDVYGLPQHKFSKTFIFSSQALVYTQVLHFLQFHQITLIEQGNNILSLFPYVTTCQWL